MRRTAKNARFPWSLGPRFIGLVEQSQRPGAHAALDEILDQFEREQPESVGARKIRCGAILAHALRVAHQAGASSEPILRLFLRGMDDVSRIRRWQQVRRYLHEYLEELMTFIQSESMGDVERVVRAIRRDLRQNISHPRALSSYALDAGIEGTYLSRRFAQIAGQTFCEERRQARVRAAAQLLIKSNLKIRAISWRVGLKDPSQLIREFKLNMGKTPAEYRRAHRRTSQGPSR